MMPPHRSTTPPLLYRRSQSRILPSPAGSGYLSGSVGGHAIHSIQIPAPGGRDHGTSQYAADVTSSAGPKSSGISGLFLAADAPQRPPASSESGVLNLSSCRPSYALESDRLTSLEGEDAALMAEEATLKARQAELKAERQMCDNEQLLLSQGWATLFDLEQRFYTEPIPDFSEDTVLCEQRCMVVDEQVHHARSHLKALEEQLAQYEPLMQEREQLRDEVQTLSSNFHTLERRRMMFLHRAGQIFDVESQRVVDAQRAEKVLHRQLVQLRGAREGGNPVKSVTFLGEKSIVLDCSSTANSVEPEERMGLTNTSSSADQTGNSSEWKLPQESICIGYDDEEDEGPDAYGIGGASAVVSLNQGAHSDSYLPLAKRQKVEVLS